MPNFEFEEDSNCGCQWVCFCHLKDEEGNIHFPKNNVPASTPEETRKHELELFQKYRHLFPKDFQP